MVMVAVPGPVITVSVRVTRNSVLLKTCVVSVVPLTMTTEEETM